MAIPHGGATILWRDGDGPHRPTKSQIRDYLNYFESKELQQFDTVEALMSSQTMAYSPGEDSVAVQIGATIHAGGSNYKVAAAAATDHHLTTAGGVKLYALPDSSGTYSVKTFGALGDGIADDTNAVQSAFDALGDTDGEIVFPKGEYLILSVITITNNARIIVRGYGATITTTPTNFGLVFFDTQTAVTAWFGLTWDGNNAGQRGIITNKSVTLKHCVMTNLWTQTTFAAGVYLNYQSLIDSEKVVAIISKSDFSNFSGITTGTVGQAAGATRAIYLRQPTLETATAIVGITENNFDGIYGREGDIIQVSATGVKATGGADRVTISNNYFGGSNRRAIKVQGWNVSIDGNTFETIDPSHSEYANDGVGGAGIVVMSSETGGIFTTGHVVSNNIFTNRNGIKASVFTWNAYADIRGNTHISPDATNHANFIENKNGGYSTVSDNVADLYGSTPFIMSDGTVVRNNTFNMYGGVSMFGFGIGAATDLHFVDNIINIKASAVSSFFGVLYMTGFANPAVTATISGNTINVPDGTDTRTRCKLAYLSGTGVLGNVLFSGNKANYEASPFYKSANVDVTHSFFMNNSNWLGSDIKMETATGANLITNPRMVTDAIGWTVSAGSAYSADYGGVVFQTGQLKQNIAVENGKTYRIVVKVRSLGNVNFNVMLGTDGSRVPFVSRQATSGTYDIYFDYTGATGSTSLKFFPVAANMVFEEVFAYEVV